MSAVVKTGQPDLARRVAGKVIDALGPDAPAGLLRTHLVRALGSEELPDGRAALTGIARDTVLLWELLGTGGADPVTGLARHLAFALARPGGNPLWEDLRRLRTLLDDLGRTLRSQRRRARLLPGAARAAHGTEQVMATAMGAFVDTWRPGRG